MAMFWRSRKTAPPLHRKQQEIAQQEAELHQKVETLERILTQARTPRENKSSPRKHDGSSADNKFEKRFHVSIAMDSPQVFDADRSRRPRALRKERRQGQIIFLILLATLGVAVMWLVNHLHP